jgi:hypothetical protein
MSSFVCTTIKAGLLPLGNQGQGHQRFAAAGGCRQDAEVPGRHRRHRHFLEVEKFATEGEVNLRQGPPPVLNPVLHPSTPEHPYQLPGEPPGDN